MPRDVFISHSSKDAALASALCTGLEARGLRCWIAPRNILSGEAWGASIVQALDDCPVLLLVLTAQANGSRQVAREVERADSKAAHILTYRVEPVVLSPSLEYFLSAYHWFDATTGRTDTHLPALSDTLHTLLASPAAPPRPSPADHGRPPPPSDQELMRSLDEMAPDDWHRVPDSRLGRLFKSFFADH